MAELQQIIEEIKLAAKGVLSKDISTMRGFSERQLRALAQQTEMVGKGLLTGDIGQDLKDFFLDSLEDMALNFVKTLKGMLQVTIEKVWNAIVGVLWDAIERISGIDFTG